MPNTLSAGGHDKNSKTLKGDVLAINKLSLFITQYLQSLQNENNNKNKQKTNEQ